MNTQAAANTDPAELAKFEQLASQWWDPDGDFRSLHRMNPLRANYIDARTPVAELEVLDVGCGGGLLCEALAQRGAQVTGIDMGKKALGVARRHLQSVSSQLPIRYLQTDVAGLAAEEPGRYDVVCCMELLEHVPDPAAVVAACRTLSKPGGGLYFSTIDRTPLAWMGAILAAEYLLRLLPKGTHDYEKLIRPAELAAWARAAGLQVAELSGVRYNPLSGRFSLSQRVHINYILRAVCR